MVDNFSHLSFGSALLFIFIICVSLVLLRGLARVITGCVVLAIASAAAFLCWQHVEVLSLKYLGQSYPILNLAAPFFVFFIIMVVAMVIAKFLTRPLAPDETPVTAGEFLRILSKLFLTLIPTSIIGIILAVILHHLGAVAVLTTFSNQFVSTKEKKDSPLIQYACNLNAFIQANTPSIILDTIDPLANPLRVRLTKAIILHEKRPDAPLISTRTKRAIEPFDAPAGQNKTAAEIAAEFKELIKSGNYGALLRHKEISTMMKNDSVIRRLKEIEL